MERIDYRKLTELDATYGTPFYIMDPDRYRSNIRAFLDAFRANGYDRILAGYSFKTNYVPALCRIAREEGCYAEVVSEMEYELASRLGFEKIIFNGPIKRKAIFERALTEGAIVNLDSEYEIDFICNFAKKYPDSIIKVGLRVNINPADAQGNSTIQSGLRFGRFGFPEEILGSNIQRLRACGVRIASIHGHTSTSDRAVANYGIITRCMLAVCQRYGLDDVEFFDIGGGFFGAAPEGMDLTGRPEYGDYARCVLSEALQSEWFCRVRPWMVIEPGSSVVSNVFSYYTKVYQKKHVAEVNFVMVDGTVFDVKPTLHQGNMPFTVYSATESSETSVCDVVGSTCMEKDVILKGVTMPLVSGGDYIEMRGVGAYTLCLTPTFINYLAPVLMKTEAGYRLVRRRQTLDDVLAVYNETI